MGKRKSNRRRGSPDEAITFLTQIKRPKVNSAKTNIDKDNKTIIHVELDDSSDAKNSNCPPVECKQSDKVEEKVKLIIDDVTKRHRNSLTIFGSGLGIEKTIRIIEELKLNYTKENVQYSQQSTIRYSEDNQPHLQVTLILMGARKPDVNESLQTETSSPRQTDSESIDEILIPTE